jgi:16S rRNA (cytosine967-C5)-methyltransferase
VSAGSGRRGQAPSNDPRRAAIEAIATLDADPTARLSDVLALRGLSARDAALAREIAYGVARRQILLDHVVGGFATRGLPTDGVARAALRVGAYQLLFLDRVPAHAAVDRSVACAPERTAGFVNAVLRRVAESLQSRPAQDERGELHLSGHRSARLARPLPGDAIERAALIAGLPGFLAHRWVEAYGPDEARRLISACSARPAMHVRAVRIDRDELVRRLAVDGCVVEPTDHPRLSRWVEGNAPMATTSFRDGLLVVQDPTAVAAAEAVGAQPGERVLDLCAAPGTKATLLAEAVGPRGVVHAFDPDRKRRKLVLDNAVRLGFPWLGLVDRPERDAPYDRVLVDAPCSNTGVLSRRVEVRHRLRPETFAALAEEQLAILRRALKLVRAGGLVVYSTCSIEPEENDGVVAAAAASPGGFTVASSVLTLPVAEQRDGGFHAVLRC